MTTWRPIGIDGWYRVVTYVEKEARIMAQWAKATDGIIVASEPMGDPPVRHPIVVRSPKAVPLMAEERR